MPTPGIVAGCSGDICLFHFRKWNSVVLYIQTNEKHILATSLENLSLDFPTKCDTNRAVPPQKIARGFQFQS